MLSTNEPGTTSWPWRAFLIAFALSFVVLAAWSVASPHMASPDEPAHAVKAAATVRGQFHADETQYRAGRGDFQVPELFAQAWSQPCYAFHPDVTAGCSPQVTGELDKIVAATSHVARYNPIYYAWIGIPTLFPLSEHTFTAMRLMSALLNAALVGLTFAVLVRLRRPLLPIAGTLAALTPMTFFIGGSMTPQGPEVFGSMLTAVALLAIVFDPRGALLAQRAWMLLAGATFFVLARGLSPAYLAFTVVVVILVAPSLATVGSVIKDRRFRWPLILCASVSVAALAYTLSSGSLALGVVYPDPSLTARDVVVGMLRNTDYYLEQILGVFGWGDTHLPMWLLILVGGVAVFVGVFGLALGGARGRLVLFGILAASIVVPILAQVMSYKDSGMVWQGKYVLPIAMLAPLVAGFLAERQEAVSFALGSRLLRVLACVFGAYETIAIVVNIHRYINGANGPWLELVPGAWHPTAPAWLTVLLVATACVGATVAIARFSSRLTLLNEFGATELRTADSSNG